MSAARLSNQKKTTQAFVDFWNKLSVPGIVSLRAPECIQETYPKESLGMPDQDNDKWVADLTPAFGSLSNFRAEVMSVTHDAEVGRSVVFANTYGDAPWGDYRNCHALFFTFNEDSTKMIKVQDMMDSAGMIKRMGMMQEWQSKQK